MKGKRVAAAAALGFLGVLSAFGCRWQYTRYTQSLHRWNRIHEAMENAQAVKLEGVDL